MTEKTIEALLREANQCWLHGQLDRLGEMLHPDVVFVAPGFAHTTRGREVALRGFADYLKVARTHEFKESEMRVEVWGDTAVGTYRFEVLYELEGKAYREWGREIWVLRLMDGTWLALWRSQIPEKGEG